MAAALTIRALAQQADVSTKTLRFWESRGLLPLAARSHTGYRLFVPETLRYVAFIRKAKRAGLTLTEMREVLRLARSGHCPCPEVVAGTDRRIGFLENEIRSLRAQLTQLRRSRRQRTSQDTRVVACDANCCYLISDLPEFQVTKGISCHEATTIRSCNQCSCTARTKPARVRSGGEMLLPAGLPALPLPLRGKGTASGQRTRRFANRLE